MAFQSAKTKRIYTSFVAFYEICHHIQTLWADQVHRELTVSLLPGFNINSILEIGAGTGLTTQLLLRRFPDSSITTLDRSKRMLQLMSRKHNASRCLKRTADISAYIDDIECYDAVVSTYCLGGVSDVHRALKNVHRALRPGGYLCLCEMVEPDRQKSRFRFFLHKIIVEPVIQIVWGFKDLEVEELLSEYKFDIIRSLYRRDRGLGSTRIVLSKKK